MKAFFSRVWRCCVDPSSYTEVSKKTFWQSYRYLYFVLFILSISATVVLLVGFVAFLPTFTRFVDDGIEQAPTWYPEELVLTFDTDGTLSTNVSEPYVIEGMDWILPNDEGEEDTAFTNAIVIDTSASIDDFYSYGAYILLTERAMVVVDDAGIKALFYSQFTSELEEPFIVTRELYTSAYKKLEPFAHHAPLIVAVGGLIALFVLPWFIALSWSVGMLVYLLFITLLSLLFARIQKKKMTYKELYILGMYVLTLPLIVTLVLEIVLDVGFIFLFSGIFLVMMWMVIGSHVSRAPRKKAKS